MTKLPFYRHGDLLIVPIAKVKPEGKRKSDTILLEGEASGHHHKLSGGVVYAEQPTTENGFLLGSFKLDKDEVLTHEEHKTIELPAGMYKFYSQREYNELDDLRVID